MILSLNFILCNKMQEQSEIYSKHCIPRLFIIMLLLVVLSVSSSPALSQDSPRETTFFFEQTMELGEGKPENRNYLIGSTWHLVTDDHGRIYLEDSQIGGIRVYDYRGDYLTTLGARGKGPGEFVEKSCMFITGDNDLIVIDRSLMRVSEFDVSLDNVEEIASTVEVHSFPYNEVISPIRSSSLPDGRFVVAYRDYYSQGDSGSHLLHFISEDWSKIEDRAFSYDYLGDMSHPYMENKTGSKYSTLNMLVVDQTTIAVAPLFYGGEVFTLRKHDGKWKDVTPHSGYVEAEAFEFYSNSNNLPEYTDELTDNSGAVINNSSIRLFKDKDGGIIHITYILIDGERQLYAEKFDSDFNLVSHGPIRNLEMDYRPRRTGLTFLWKDHNDQFYVYDFRDTTERKILRGYIRERTH